AGADSHLLTADSVDAARARVAGMAETWRHREPEDVRYGWEALRLVIPGSPMDGGWELVDADVAGYALYMARPSEEVRSTLAHARQRPIAVVEQQTERGLRCTWSDDEGDSVSLYLTSEGWRTGRGRPVTDAEAWTWAYVGTYPIRSAL